MKRLIIAFALVSLLACPTQAGQFFIGGTFPLYKDNAAKKGKSKSNRALWTFLVGTGITYAIFSIPGHEVFEPRERVMYAVASGASFATGHNFFPQSEGSSVTHGNVSTYGNVDSRIDGEFEGWDGDTVFTLMNGQVWQQSSYSYFYHYRYSPRVLIFKQGYGYVMKVDGVDRTVQVKRLR
jgi:hypothetical protein